MRGLAAVMIVLFHYTHQYNASYAGERGPIDLGWSVSFGYAAVATFFMLSGYLAARYIYARAMSAGNDGKPMAPGRFIVKKLKRFYPVYWVCMTLSALTLTMLFAEERVSIGQWAANLTMVSPLMGVPFVDGAYWTMQCELLFCLIGAALMFVRRPRTIDYILIGWIVLSMILSFTLGVKALKFVRIATVVPHCQGFIAGIAIWRLHKAGHGQVWMAVATLLLCVANCVLWYGPTSPDVYFLVVSAIMLYLADRLDYLISGNNLVIRVIAWIAAISYPLYLLHEMIGFAILHHLQGYGLNHPALLIIPATVVVFVAWLVHEQVERRIK